MSFIYLVNKIINIAPRTIIIIHTHTVLLTPKNDPAFVSFTPTTLVVVLTASPVSFATVLPALSKPLPAFSTTLAAPSTVLSAPWLIAFPAPSITFPVPLTTFSVVFFTASAPVFTSFLVSFTTLFSPSL